MVLEEAASGLEESIRAVEYQICYVRSAVVWDPGMVVGATPLLKVVFERVHLHVGGPGFRGGRIAQGGLFGLYEHCPLCAFDFV